jgi:hypothetical protein
MSNGQAASNLVMKLLILLVVVEEGDISNGSNSIVQQMTALPKNMTISNSIVELGVEGSDATISSRICWGQGRKWW